MFSGNFKKRSTSSTVCGTMLCGIASVVECYVRRSSCGCICNCGIMLRKAYNVAAVVAFVTVVSCYVRRSPCPLASVVECYVRRSPCRLTTVVFCYIRCSPCRLASLVLCYVRCNHCRLTTVHHLRHT